MMRLLLVPMWLGGLVLVATATGNPIGSAVQAVLTALTFYQR